MQYSTAYISHAYAYYIVHCRSVADGMHRIRGRWQYYVLAFRGETT